MKKYDIIFQNLKRLIETGIILPGFQIPTEKELMKQNNVSRVTAQRAVNMLAEQGLVHRVPGKGTFVNVPEAVVNKADSPYFVTAIVMYSSYDANKILSGIEKELSKFDIQLTVGIANNDPKTERKLLLDALQMGSSGIFIYPLDENGESNDLYAHLVSEEYPLVFLDRLPFDIPASLVTSNNFAGAYAATEYLIEKGHRAIGIAGYSFGTSQVCRARYNGYREALLKHGILPNPKFCVDSGNFLPAMEAFLRRKELPTALFCINDILAHETIGLAQKVGVDVPGDLSVMGFDDSPLSENTTLAMTTVRQDLTEIGVQAGRLMRELLLAKKRVQKQIFIPVKLVIRDSVKTLSP